MSIQSFSQFYSPCDSSQLNDNCPICIEPLRDEEIVCHRGDGKKHPLHTDCAKTAFKVMKFCPTCRDPFVLPTPLPLEERHPNVVILGIAIFVGIINGIVQENLSVMSVARDSIGQFVLGHVFKYIFLKIIDFSQPD